MQKNKQLKLLILALFAVVFVAGCVTKPVVNQQQPANNQNEINTKKANLNFSDIKEWKTFKENDINFTFSYPSSWEYTIQKIQPDIMSITFNSEHRNKEMIIDIPIPAVGFEPWEVKEINTFISNDPNTGLLLVNMKSRNSEERMNMKILEWSKGVTKEQLEENDKIFYENASWLYIVRYEDKDESYYNKLINKIVNTFSFVE